MFNFSALQWIKYWVFHYILWENGYAAAYSAYRTLGACLSYLNVKECSVHEWILGGRHTPFYIMNVLPPISVGLGRRNKDFFHTRWVKQQGYPCHSKCVLWNHIVLALKAVIFPWSVCWTCVEACETDSLLLAVYGELRESESPVRKKAGNLCHPRPGVSGHSFVMASDWEPLEWKLLWELWYI